MTVFWIVAALFVLGALLLMLPPLLRGAPGDDTDGPGANLAVHRDQLLEAERDLANDLITPERFEQTRAEIERRAFEDIVVAETGATRAGPARGCAIALATLITLGSALTYLAIGNPQATTPQLARVAPPDAGGRHSVTPEQIDARVTALAERLRANPNDAEGWLILGRSYTALGRYRDAAIALRRANDLTPQNASLLADLADLVGMAQGKRLTGEPARLIQQALDIDPRHAKALALAGSAAFEAKDYASARRYWEGLIAVLPPDSPMLLSVRGSLAQAASLDAGATPATATAPVAAATVAATAATAAGPAPAQLTGTVRLAAALAAQVGPGDTLFVFARSAAGQRIPLAILRGQASLPFAFALDDSMAMSPQWRLSGATRVVVGARISKSGNATPQPGDLLGQSAEVASGARDVQVLIDRVQP